MINQKIKIRVLKLNFQYDALLLRKNDKLQTCKKINGELDYQSYYIKMLQIYKILTFFCQVIQTLQIYRRNTPTRKLREANNSAKP